MPNSFNSWMNHDKQIALTCPILTVLLYMIHDGWFMPHNLHNYEVK